MKKLFLFMLLVSLSASCISQKINLIKYSCTVSAASYISQAEAALSFGGFTIIKSDTLNGSISGEKMMSLAGSGKTKEMTSIRIESEYLMPSSEVVVKTFKIRELVGKKIIKEINYDDEPQIQEEIQLTIDRLKNICKYGKFPVNS